MTKKILIGVGILAILLMGFNLFSGGSSKGGSASQATTTESGAQLIEISAKGGYSPRQISATSGQETLIRFSTNNTYDCSAAMTIPSLGVSEFLEPTGTKEITVPADKASGDMLITCSMGMYSSTINFS